jgi:hypothetical protein
VAVRGCEQLDGVGVGLDGPAALVLGLQGAPEASVEGRRYSRGSWWPGATGGVDDIVALIIVALIRVWCRDWLTAACSG